MKKLFLLIALVLVSCSKDEEPEKEFTKADLIGTWQIEAVNGNSSLDACASEGEIVFTETNLSLTKDCETSAKQYQYNLIDKRVEFEQVLDGSVYVGRINGSKLSVEIFENGNKTIYTYIKS